MTPQQKATARRIVLNWILTPTAVLGALGFGVRQVDGLYVRRVAFDVYQQGLAKKALVDSLNYAGDMREVRRILSGLDSSDRCRRGQQGFCR